MVLNLSKEGWINDDDGFFSFSFNGVWSTWDKVCWAGVIIDDWEISVCDEDAGFEAVNIWWLDELLFNDVLLDVLIDSLFCLEELTEWNGLKNATES